MTRAFFSWAPQTRTFGLCVEPSAEPVRCLEDGRAQPPPTMPVRGDLSRRPGHVRVRECLNLAHCGADELAVPIGEESPHLTVFATV